MSCLWIEWRAVGRLIGVRSGDLPADCRWVTEYFAEVVANRLERTAAVEDVLDRLHAPGAPPLPWVIRVGWPLAGVPLAHAHVLVTTGLLPSLLRERFGLGWSRAQEVELRLLARASRSTTPALGAARIVGPAYLRLRARHDADVRSGG
jgi:uncharacterized protein (DUF2236 family)